MTAVRNRCCLESTEGLSDGEFWELVFHRDDVAEPIEFDDPSEPVIEARGAPCMVCGELGPCGYDTQGLPLIHLVPDDDVELTTEELEPL